jgi:2-haloacid dehalogenase
MNRRQFLRSAAAGIAAGISASSRTAQARSETKIEAIAFDAFPILDPRPISAHAERLFPGRGAALVDAWRTRQFEYQWLRALSAHYADFWTCTEDALEFAADLTKLDLTPEKRSHLMGGYLELAAWPDAPQALNELRRSGVRLAVLSNATPAILDAGIRRSQLGGVFEHVLSTDAVQSFKPDPRAYRMAIDAFGVTRSKILFVAFAGWDAAGAKSFGFPTYWVNRSNLPAERLGVRLDGMGTDLADLVGFVRSAAEARH